MAVDPTVQVLSSAVDAAGVSISTATRTAANLRNGTIYNPTTFAAGVPVWFHRLQDGRYLGVFKSRWTAATAVYHDGPQMFSAHTETTVPSFASIDPTTGTIDGPSLPPGMAVTDVVTAAVSRNDYLFVVGTRGEDEVPWVWHYFITRTGGLQLQAQEQVPLGYGLGLHVTTTHLVIYGRHTTGYLARVRKHWGRIGNNADAVRQWEYEGLKGWLTDTAPHAPMATATGVGIPADGPCSVATFKDNWYVTATEHSVGAYAAEIYTQRTIEQSWNRLGDEVVPLGDDADYLGGTAYLQPQLVANKALLPEGANTGVPYVTSVRVVVGDDEAILTEWGLLTV